jgi:hypothetical protein
MELTELADQLFERAKTGIPLAPHRMLPPVIIMQMPDGVLLPAFIHYDTDAERAESMASAGQLMRALGAVAYAFMYEGWTLPPINAGDPVPPGRARDHPDRIESLIVDSHNLAGERLVIVAKIERDPDKRVGDVIIREKAAKTERGDLVNLLHQRPAADVAAMMDAERERFEAWARRGWHDRR